MLNNGRDAVIAGTYAVTDSQVVLTPMDFLVSIPMALAAVGMFDYGAAVQPMIG